MRRFAADQEGCCGRAARGIAHVPEGRRIFPKMTVLLVEQNTRQALQEAYLGG